MSIEQLLPAVRDYLCAFDLMSIVVTADGRINGTRDAAGARGVVVRGSRGPPDYLARAQGRRRRSFGGPSARDRDHRARGGPGAHRSGESLIRSRNDVAPPADSLEAHQFRRNLLLIRMVFGIVWSTKCVPNSLPLAPNAKLALPVDPGGLLQ
jgi:hypothetical protein